MIVFQQSSCLFRRLDEGIDEFIFTELSPGALRDWARTVQGYLASPTLPPTLHWLIDLRHISILPQDEIFQGVPALVPSYGADERELRIAYVTPDIALFDFFRAHLTQLLGMQCHAKWFPGYPSADSRQQVLEWLLKGVAPTERESYSYRYFG